jgi:hypothetical protein
MVMTDDHARRMDEFSQGPKRAVAKAVAPILKIQKATVHRKPLLIYDDTKKPNVA